MPDIPEPPGAPGPGPEDHAIALTKAGIARRNAGELDIAEDLFRTVIALYPNLLYGWQELAAVHAARGEPKVALQLFKKAVRLGPEHFQTLLQLVRHQISLGALKDARRSLRGYRPDSEETLELSALYREFLDFISIYSKSRGLKLAEALQNGGNFLDPTEVETRIFNAIETAAPLSLIRLGDGEGAWLSLGARDEARFACLYEANRRKTLKTWFGDDKNFGLPSFLASRARLLDAIGRADILGVPTGPRIVHEYGVSGLNGVTSNVNILRWLPPGGRPGSPNAYCSQDIHIQLHLRGFYRKLLDLPVTFGIISCHPELGHRLASGFGARVVQMLIVPEERGFADIDARLTPIDGISGVTIPHFPVAYHRICEKLRRDRGQARVWLIAAGYLGKIYCDAARDSGAVALDIGSIVDGWAGTVSRPYLQNLQAFQL